MSYGSTDLSALTNPILSPSAALKPLIIAPPLPNLFSKFNNLIFGCFLDIFLTMGCYRFRRKQRSSPNLGNDRNIWLRQLQF